MIDEICKSPITVSEVRIRIAETEDECLIGWASCVVNQALRLNNISIRKNQTGEIVLSFPFRKSSGDTEYYYFNPISHEASDEIRKAVLQKLEMIGNNL